MTIQPAQTPGPHSVQGGLLVLGQVLVTPGVHQAHLGAAQEALQRFAKQDYGSVEGEDLEVNQEAMKQDERLMGVYPSGEVTLWIIREAVSPTGEWETVTTVLLPEEY